MKSVFAISFVLFSFLTSAQLTEHELQEVNVTDSNNLVFNKVLTIRRPTILELHAEDAGQLLQKLSGVAIRSYGGLGGLKTISVRSLGSQHTNIVVDGFSLSNTQTGQLNLGQIQTENIESIQLIVGAQKSYLIPASAMVSGSSVFIETFENSFSSIKNQLRLSSKVGSFGQYDNYLGYKFSKARFFLSAFGKYRFADGTYPYSFQNGQTIYTGERTNNFYTDANAGFAVGWKPSEKGTFTLALKKDYSDQELPGAVILYSSTAAQTLSTGSDRLQSDYTHHFKTLSLRTFGSIHKTNMNYIDSTYLNTAGGINSLYSNLIVQGGLSARWKLGENLALSMASEEQWSTLHVNDSLFGIPTRFHNFSILGAHLNLRFMRIIGQLSTQFIAEERESVKRENVMRVNPFLQIESSEFGDKTKLNLNAFYRNSFRMPSFNELYYNSIGNINLKPENADQLSVGCIITSKLKKISFINRTNIYFNQVRDKIIAVPTKNLFIWSMQNVGKVNILGAETSFEFAYSVCKNWTIFASLNYTFQSVKDITERSSPTFGHQIAYVPVHTGNLDLTVKRKNTGIRISNFMNSQRYSLNENIPSNVISGFNVTDLAVFTRLSIKQHDFRLQFTCKNVFNSSYAIVRYYVMPGRNFLISLNYALK